MVDYPGKIASVIFLGGCNWRCPYCYNVDLVLPERLRELPDLSEEEVLSELRRREGFIKGVVVTGGEPTIWGRRLRGLLERIRYETGLEIKLDTNGSNPELLERLLEAGLVDYLALDFKTAPSRYEELGGRFEPVKRSLELLKGLDGRAEVRITVVPALVSEKEISEMMPYLEGIKRVALQKFLPDVPRLSPDLPGGYLAKEEILTLAEKIRSTLSTEVLLRV